MEILSTGEKIKRTRIYNGVTLKELCADKISISKMSCIENGKVKADKDILRYIADKLEIDFEYLAKDVYEQIESNIVEAENSIFEVDYEKVLNFNLEYAIAYDYNDLALKLVHKIFLNYVENKEWEKISSIIPTYYQLYSKDNSVKNTILYFSDLGNYLICNNEYNEASIYFKKILDILDELKKVKEKSYVYASYKFGMCKVYAKDYEEAKKYLDDSIYKIKMLREEDIIIKGEIYHLSAINNIFLNESPESNIKKAREIFLDDRIKMLNLKLDYVKAYFAKNKVEKAKEIVEDIFKEIPEESTEKVADILVRSLKILKENNQFEYIEKILEDALNVAIGINDLPLIERVYYIKGMYLQENGRFDEGEMHLNLSLDALAKFGTKKDLYDRYIDLGELNHKVRNLKESIKYFDLAMDIKRKMQDN